MPDTPQQRQDKRGEVESHHMISADIRFFQSDDRWQLAAGGKSTKLQVSRSAGHAKINSHLEVSQAK